MRGSTAEWASACACRALFLQKNTGDNPVINHRIKSVGKIVCYMCAPVLPVCPDRETHPYPQINL